MNPAAPSLARLDAALRDLVGRPLVWVALLATVTAWPVLWAVRARVPPPPPVLGAAPAFRLTDQRGGAFGSDDLAGRVWIASFVATGAPASEGTRHLARLQARARNLEPALHLVSFAVGPSEDTPERLLTYARDQRASPRMWTFLAGPPEVVRSLERELRGPEDGHSGEGALVLVDAAARIRGRYDPRAPGTVERLLRDAALLVNRGR